MPVYSSTVCLPSQLEQVERQLLSLGYVIEKYQAGAKWLILYRKP